MKLLDFASHAWPEILRTIERGERPRDHDLCRAFTRGEPLSLEQQRVIAKLFDGSLKKGKGRPKCKEIQKIKTRLRRTMNDYCLFFWVNELAEEALARNAADPLRDALEQATAQIKGGGLATIRRRYNRGKAEASLPE